MREKRGPSHPHIRNCCCQLFVFEVYTKELLGKRHLRENGKKKRDSRKGRSREPLYDELKCTPWEEKKPERDGLPRGPSAFLLKAKVIVYLPERIWFVYRTINRILYYHSSILHATILQRKNKPKEHFWNQLHAAWIFWAFLQCSLVNVNLRHSEKIIFCVLLHQSSF